MGQNLRMHIVDDTVRTEPQLFNTTAQIPANSVFHGEFTCCAQNHLDSAGNVFACDKVALAHVVSTLHAGACARLRAAGEMSTWRKVLSLRHVVLSGADTPVAPVLTLEEFLEKYEIASVQDVVGSKMTAMHYAAYENNGDVVRKLVQASAECSPQDEDSMTPLHLCGLSIDASDAARALLEARAQVNVIARFQGTTPLIGACLYDSAEVAQLLLEFKAAIEGFETPGAPQFPVPGLRGMGPLHIAVALGSSSCVKALLSARSDLSALVGEGGPRAGLDVFALLDDVVRNPTPNFTKFDRRVQIELQRFAGSTLLHSIYTNVGNFRED